MGSWKGATIWRGLEHGSRGISIVRSRYQATTSKVSAGWNNLASVFKVEIAIVL
jgi:hypothetical protein